MALELKIDFPSEFFLFTSTSTTIVEAAILNCDMSCILDINIKL